MNLVCIVVQQNYDGLMDFGRLAHEVRADGVVVHPVDDVCDPCMERLVPTEAQAAAVREQVPELARYLEERGIRHNLARFSVTFGGRLDTRELYKVIPCYVGWLSLQVHATGDVHACCRCYCRLGNAYETPIREIWEGAAYREFRRAAGQINRRGTPVEACSCYACAPNGVNVRVFRRLHPLSRRLKDLEHAVYDPGGRGGVMPCD